MILPRIDLCLELLGIEEVLFTHPELTDIKRGNDSQQGSPHQHWDKQRGYQTPPGSTVTEQGREKGRRKKRSCLHCTHTHTCKHMHKRLLAPSYENNGSLHGVRGKTLRIWDWDLIWTGPNLKLNQTKLESHGIRTTMSWREPPIQKKRRI